MDYFFPFLFLYVQRLQTWSENTELKVCVSLVSHASVASCRWIIHKAQQIEGIAQHRHSLIPSSKQRRLYSVTSHETREYSWAKRGLSAHWQAQCHVLLCLFVLFSISPPSFLSSLPPAFFLHLSWPCIAMIDVVERAAWNTVCCLRLYLCLDSPSQTCLVNIPNLKKFQFHLLIWLPLVAMKICSN